MKNGLRGLEKAGSALRLFQQREVFVAGDACGAQVVHDDEDRNGSIAGNDNGTGNPLLRVDPMISLLSSQLEARELKDTTQLLIGDRGDSRHRKTAELEDKLHMLGGDERGGAPVRSARITRHEPFFTEDVLQGAHALAFFEEEADGFLHPTAGLLDGITTTGDTQLGAVADERLAFLEDQRGELNLLHSTHEYSLPDERSQTRNPKKGWSALVMLIMALGFSLAASADVRPNEPGQAAAHVNHESPVTLARSYFQAYTGGDAEGMLECYMPESRAAVQGMLGYVKPTMADASELRYEVMSDTGDQAAVKVTGPYVTPAGEQKTVETTIKLKKLDTGWYLDDL